MRRLLRALFPRYSFASLDADFRALADHRNLLIAQVDLLTDALLRCKLEKRELEHDFQVMADAYASLYDETHGQMPLSASDLSNLRVFRMMN
jgi:hypothetical protein